MPGVLPPATDESDAKWDLPGSRPADTARCLALGRPSGAVASRYPPAMQMSADVARTWWRALAQNCTELLEDAVRLAAAGSWGRAEALTVLAKEELAKAVAIDEHARHTWSVRTHLVDLPDDFDDRLRRHQVKLERAVDYDERLEPFWGDEIDPALVPPLDLGGEALTTWYADAAEQARQIGRAMNRAKQAGLYVDRDGEQVRSPADRNSDGILSEIVRTARVANMHLIEDHSRMKADLPADAYDGTLDLQWRLMAIGYPDEVAERG